eukprot:13109669-Alexandrium_andersonii.AAC.1
MPRTRRAPGDVGARPRASRPASGEGLHGANRGVGRGLRVVVGRRVVLAQGRAHADVYPASKRGQSSAAGPRPAATPGRCGQEPHRSLP